MDGWILYVVILSLLSGRLESIFHLLMGFVLIA
jgi:hypothetical protein